MEHTIINEHYLTGRRECIKVYVRICPVLNKTHGTTHELNEHIINDENQTQDILKETNSVIPCDYGCLIIQGNQSVTVSYDNHSHLFVMDWIFSPLSTQKEVYEKSAKIIVESVLEGYHGAVIAYGQTGTGKTYTMQGGLLTENTFKLSDKYNNVENGDDNLFESTTLKTPSDNHLGIISRMVHTVFNFIDTVNDMITFELKISIFQIYNEKLYDLLNPSKLNLIIRENKDNGVFIQNLTELIITTPEELFKCIQYSQIHRCSRTTHMNLHSSRSHCIFRLSILQKNNNLSIEKMSRLYLVDLAGSEKVAKTGADGQALDESRMINKSLACLGNVINALTFQSFTHGTQTHKPKSHIPFRDSKLTRVLQETLGGHSKTCLICTIAPDTIHAPETLSTLRFGKRAKLIQHTFVLNAKRSTQSLETLLNKALQKIKLQSNYILFLQKTFNIKPHSLSLIPETLTPDSHVSTDHQECSQYAHVCESGAKSFINSTELDTNQHVASLVENQHVAFLLKNEEIASPVANQHIASLEKNQHIPSLLKDEDIASLLKDEDIASLVANQHIASLQENNYAASLLKDEDIASLVANQHIASLQENNYAASLQENNYAASLLNSEDIGSLLKNGNIASLVANQHIASLQENNYAASLQENNYAASLLNSEDIGSLLKNGNIASLVANQHIASLQENNYAASVLEDEEIAYPIEHQHIASLVEDANVAFPLENDLFIKDGQEDTVQSCHQSLTQRKKLLQNEKMDEEQIKECKELHQCSQIDTLSKELHEMQMQLTTERNRTLMFQHYCLGHDNNLIKKNETFVTVETQLNDLVSLYNDMFSLYTDLIKEYNTLLTILETKDAIIYSLKEEIDYYKTQYGTDHYNLTHHDTSELQHTIMVYDDKYHREIIHDVTPCTLTLEESSHINNDKQASLSARWYISRLLSSRRLKKKFASVKGRARSSKSKPILMKDT